MNDIEQRICDWLVINFEPKLKDHFLADLSWAGDGTRPQAISNFFTKRIGKRVFELLPDDIKNYILANSL
jgi:hypothetical protein